jgi:iron complex outermembrane receptor protein
MALMLAGAAGGLGYVHAAAADAVGAANPVPAGERLGEVIVTAQRREENLQKVPIAITAVGGAALEAMGVSSTTNLSVAAPAVTFNQSPAGGASVTIRGVTSSGSIGDESATSVYVDGVYLAGTPGLYFGLADVDHVEVLKGPQGTLFGRNSVGGAIQIITRTPQQTPSMDVSAGYGNYGTVQSQFYGTTGLNDQTAIDLSLYGSDQTQGWGRNDYTGQHAFTGWQYAARSKLLWKNDATRVTLSASYSAVKWPPIQGYALLPGQLNAAGEGYRGFYTVDANIPDSYISTQATASATVNQTFSFAQLTDIAAWEDTALKGLLDNDYSHLTPSSLGRIRASTNKYSEELQLASLKGSAISWIGGFYYLDAEQARSQLTTGPVAAPSTYTYVDSTEPIRSYAVYGQATAQVLPRTNLTLGARYTLDEHALNGVNLSSKAPTVAPILASIEDNAFTYRAALSTDINSNVMVYASTSTGFKSGLYSLSVPTAPPARPSYLYAYEVGIKSVVGQRLRLNAAAFYNDDEHVQTKAFIDLNGASVAETINAAAAYAKGVDIDAEFKATDTLSFRAGLSYLDSRYGKFLTAQCYFPTVGAQGLIVGYTSRSCDATNNHTEQSPEWVTTLSADYRKDTPIGAFLANLTTNYNSGYYFDPQNIVPSHAYQLLNGSLRWRPKDSHWEVRLWADNIGGAHYWTSVTEYKLGFEGAPSSPRTFGFTVDYRL